MSELYHYGVLGMRWGIRNYQDKNGKLTKEGRQHYKEFKKEVRKENARARELGSDATDFSKANIKLISVRAKRQNRLEKAIRKDPLVEKKSTQRKAYKLQAAINAEKATSIQAQVLSGLSQAHQKQLIDKYGQEHVSNINFKDRKLSRIAQKYTGLKSVHTIDEGGHDTRLSSFAASIGSYVGASLAGLPVAVLFIGSDRSSTIADRALGIADSAAMKEWREKRKQQ